MTVNYVGYKPVTLFIDADKGDVDDVADDSFAVDADGIGTIAGESGTVYVFDFTGGYQQSSIHSPHDKTAATPAAYDTNGRKVGAGYRGVVIENGKKRLRR